MRKAAASERKESWHSIFRAQLIFGKDNANERNENSFSNCRVQLIFCKDTNFTHDIQLKKLIFFDCCDFFSTFGKQLKANIILKRFILSIFLICPLLAGAQKITLGTCTTKDGGEYNGEMSAGKPEGKGKTIYKNGNRYEGAYVKGKRQGYGVYTFFDGEKYEGEWFQDQQHGRGTFYFANNNKYVGLWFRDYQQGHGVMYYYNGDKYDGEWKQDHRSGVAQRQEKRLWLF